MLRHTGGGGPRPCHQMTYGGERGSKIGKKKCHVFFEWSLKERQDKGGVNFQPLCSYSKTALAGEWCGNSNNDNNVMNR